MVVTVFLIEEPGDHCRDLRSPRPDVLYVELADVKDPGNEGEEVHPGVVLMLDAVGKIIGIEIRPQHLPWRGTGLELGERLARLPVHISSSREQAIREAAAHYEETMKNSRIASAAGGSSARPRMTRRTQDSYDAWRWIVAGIQFAAWRDDLVSLVSPSKS